jgi:hypothetical protein
VFEGSQITIEVPFGYAHRDRLLEFLKSRLPGAEVSIVHSDVTNPTVEEVFVRRDATSEAAVAAAEAPGEDSESVLLKASDALAAFSKSAR